MSAATSMRAAQIVEYSKPYQLRTVPVPQIKPTELLVEIHAAGFCHSDAQTLSGQFSSPLPLIPSHEPAGVIAAVGSQCDPDAWKIGDRVGILNFKNACDACTGCALARRRYGGLDPRFCERRETAGFQHDGAFAEFMTADPVTTIKLPPSLSLEQAAPLMCAGATVWGALEKTMEQIEPHGVVAIVGIGGLGHLGVQLAKSQGFKTIALDSRHEGRLLATQVPENLQPDLVLDSTSPDAASQIRQFTDGEGLAAAIVCTDNIEVNAWALNQLGVGGVMVALGLPAERWQFDSEAIVFRELTIRGSYVTSAESTRRMMKAVGEHGVRSHITTVGMDDIPGILDMYHDKAFKGRLVVRIKSES